MGLVYLINVKSLTLDPTSSTPRAVQTIRLRELQVPQSSEEERSLWVRSTNPSFLWPLLSIWILFRSNKFWLHTESSGTNCSPDGIRSTVICLPNAIGGYFGSLYRPNSPIPLFGGQKAVNWASRHWSNCFVQS